MFFTYIVFGFISGIILNFMPCILPILGIKMLGIAKISDKKDVKFTAISTIFGILTFMILLSFVFVFAKEFWGFQMQNGGFIASLLFLLIIFGAILMNFITIYNPSFLQFFADIKTNSIFLKSFFSGFLIVVFSASCTGPIIAIAVSLGVQDKSFFAMPIICFFMGLGLSLPYFLMIFFPQFVIQISHKKKFSYVAKLLSVTMMSLTIIFVLYLLYRQSSLSNFLIFITIILFFIILTKIFKRLFIVLIGIFTIFFFNTFFVQNPLKPLHFKGVEEFDETKIAGYLEDGKKVFIRFEAAWCLTCLANDVFSLKTGELEKLLHENNVIYMKGNLTNHNIVLENFMKKFNSYGLPFNALFTKKNPEGKLLPLLLSLNDLKTELKDS